MIKLLIVDDHPVVLDGTMTLLQELEDFHIETEHDSSAVERRLEKDSFHLFLLDINMKPVNGIQLAEFIKQREPEALVILYTGFELADYYELILKRKIDGLLSKTATKEQVIQTIHAVLRREILLPTDFLDFVQTQLHLSLQDSQQTLSDKERLILNLIAQGCTNKAIAVELSVTQRTVENYLSKLFVKLHVESRAEALKIAMEKGWIE
ncbi:response regulator transcription factor [Sutcliffiella horikoshii]|uniref:response regulator transcription factor n=1 Tax=Sutcliffiella horikoshii TaxID=79883 RepID=UPI001F22583B|nr:response regulator transcription factor [Sutcliffiella horikoshii]